jgi:hypothetical protein
MFCPTLRKIAGLSTIWINTAEQARIFMKTMYFVELLLALSLEKSNNCNPL